MKYLLAVFKMLDIRPEASPQYRRPLDALQAKAGGRLPVAVRQWNEQSRSLEMLQWLREDNTASAPDERFCGTMVKQSHLSDQASEFVNQSNRESKITAYSGSVTKPNTTCCVKSS